MGSPSTNAVALRTANSNAQSLLANCPRIPREVDSPSSSKIEADATNVLPLLQTQG
jgi:hypothetical protein